MDPAPRKTHEAELEEILREAAAYRTAANSSPGNGMPAEEQPSPPPPLALAEGREPDTPTAGVRIRYEFDRLGSESGDRPLVRVTPKLLLSLGLGVVVGFLWLRLLVAPPSAASPGDTAYADASARWALVLTGERVDSFRRKNHRAPANLVEVGYPGPRLIRYERLSDDRYRLTAATSNGPLVFDSMQSRRNFLGRSLEVLRRQVGHGS